MWGSGLDKLVGWAQAHLAELDVAETINKAAARIAGAREVLDADHFGLGEVKDRIIEYLAVRRRRADRNLGVVGGRRSGAVLALVGWKPRLPTRRPDPRTSPSPGNSVT